MTEEAEKSTHPEFAAEFDMLLARAGMSVPDDRKAGVLAGYAELRRLAQLLRTRRSPFDEPANIYDLTRISRD
jgi:hypothetical protein